LFGICCGNEDRQTRKQRKGQSVESAHDL
jgi:hypothetical protein